MRASLLRRARASGARRCDGAAHTARDSGSANISTNKRKLRSVAVGFASEERRAGTKNLGTPCLGLPCHSRSFGPPLLAAALQVLRTLHAAAAAAPLRARLMVVPAKEAAAAVALLESTTLREYLDTRHAEPHAIGMYPKQEVCCARVTALRCAAERRCWRVRITSLTQHRLRRRSSSSPRTRRLVTP
jgi:hypothetical protein